MAGAHEREPASRPERRLSKMIVFAVSPAAVSSLMLHSSAPIRRVLLCTSQSRIGCSSDCSATTAQSSVMNSSSPCGNASGADGVGGTWVMGPRGVDGIERPSLAGSVLVRIYGRDADAQQHVGEREVALPLAFHGILRASSAQGEMPMMAA